MDVQAGEKRIRLLLLRGDIPLQACLDQINGKVYSRATKLL